MQDLDLSSVHELVQTLDPVVRHARGTSGGLEDAVNAALARYLPELVPWAREVVSTMQLYYGDMADLPTSTLSVWAGGDRTTGPGTPTTLSGQGEGLGKRVFRWQGRTPDCPSMLPV